ncbi:MAG: alanine racemase [Clostridia bacterium]
MRNNFAIISLGNLKYNMDVIRQNIKPETKYLAVVKANAYGHGMEAVSRAALEHGAAYLAVAFAEEGVRLRDAGFTCPILLLGATDESRMDSVLDYDLIPTIFTLDTLQELQQHAARKKKICHFHIKIDTGMNRIGFKSKQAFLETLEALKQSPNLDFSGMFTHFAVSEIEDPSFTLKQGALFGEYVALAHEHGYHPLLHASNSGGALRFPELQFDMVRGGIAMYGYHPVGHPVEGVNLKPVLCWQTAIVHLKEIQPGEAVSYGLKFVAEHPMQIATLPVGYGDGYKRCLSGKASVLIHGKRAPQIGTICMDQMMVDVTDIPDAIVGDDAVLIGSQGQDTITADEMAVWADTISYEILLCISDRVPRVFVG